MAEVDSVSRTRIREAISRLTRRGVVQLIPRPGWFLIKPSAEKAFAVYEARCAIACGLLRNMTALPAVGRQILVDYLEEERQTLAVADRQWLTCPGDFYIRIAEIAGNEIIIDLLRDLTAHTILIPVLYQSDFQAAQSHEGHCRIFEAMDAGDFLRASELAATRLDEAKTGLDLTRRQDRHFELLNSLFTPLFNDPL